jgi:hypothetical protein
MHGRRLRVGYEQIGTQPPQLRMGLDVLLAGIVVDFVRINNYYPINRLVAMFLLIDIASKYHLQSELQNSVGY